MEKVLRYFPVDFPWRDTTKNIVFTISKYRITFCFHNRRSWGREGCFMYLATEYRHYPRDVIPERVPGEGDFIRPDTRYKKIIIFNKVIETFLEKME